MSDSLREGFYELGVGDAATIVIGEKLYCVGGFRVEYDADLKLFYQSPQVKKECWSAEFNRWHHLSAYSAKAKFWAVGAD